MNLSKNEKELLRRLGLGKENAKTTKEIIRGLPITERGERDRLNWAIRQILKMGV